MITFTVITPTLQRQSLAAMCQSIDTQTYNYWSHIVQIDCAEMDDDLIFSLAHPKRQFLMCDKPHRDGGNTCRRLALEHALGDYIFFGDDDNLYADQDIFRDIAVALDGAGRPPWALFPIWRLGGRFYCDPPRSCHVDTMNFVLRRDVAYWPDTDAYGTDGILIDDLMARKIPYTAFPEFRNIAILPKISFGK